MAVRADRMPNRTGTRRARDWRLAAGSLVWVRPAAHAIRGGWRLPEHGEVFDRGPSLRVGGSVVPERGGDRLMARYQRSRTRRALKWGGTVLCAAIMAVGITSAWWQVCWNRQGGPLVSLSAGRVYISLEQGQGPSPGWIARREKPAVFFWTRYPLKWEPQRHTVCCPLWVLFLIAIVPTGLLWWRDRRRIPPGYCQKCGYNLTGNVSGRCPECGECSRANKGNGLETKRSP